MAGRRFDEKFGKDLLSSLPEAPAVYLFRDDHDQVLYVGKAKDVRRRLSSYRNATRRKAHRKMRTIVREAESVEVRPQESEHAALLVENELIRELRPPYNVDGAYSFLYPSIGVRQREGQALFCFTTSVDAWAGLGFRWYGSFRSRLRTKDAFDAMIDLTLRLGHLEPRTRLLFAGRVGDYPVGGVRTVYDLEGTPILIKRTEDGFKAFNSTCPHLGCKVHWEADRERFLCPCHNGEFDADGVAYSGPPADAGQRLAEVSLDIDEDAGVVYLDVKDPKRRST